MQPVLLSWRAALLAVAMLGSSLALPAGFPAAKEADWTARDFRFHTGEVMPALRIHYTTVASPSGELGIMERELPRIKGARLYLIPASEETRGHGTIGMARFWKAQPSDFLASVARR